MSSGRLEAAGVEAVGRLSYAVVASHLMQPSGPIGLLHY